ncbi:type II secretion system F family protein [Arthrobacter sp. H5]|uniref:type II secretion system F family protein n=1 Tax=Arthrobacter sp. H5 TaxID=1267973 RepID=UPI000481463A|nr:type II secretion system F family protein [Arthrobacter sp. H5]
MESPLFLLASVGLCFGALLLVVLVVFKPRHAAIPLDRRRPSTHPELSVFSRVTESTVARVDGVVGRNGGLYSDSVLYNAGVKMKPADFTVFVAAAAAVSGIVFGILSHPVLGVFAALLAPVAAKVVLAFRTGRRRAKFEAQLPDTIQTLIGGLRAGHSVLRSIDAVAIDAEAPTAEELGRILNEARIGKDSSEAIEESADRMDNEDFKWIAQAIQIHREVGGDLAEVLEHVAETIRERTQIKGQIRSLSAEGIMSSYILMALPVGIFVLFTIINPTYITVLTTSVIGFALIGVSIVMYIIGGFWLSRMVKIKF